MINVIKAVVNGFLFVAVLTCSILLAATEPTESDISRWVSNAVQWDARWGNDVVTCAGHSFALSKQLSAADHVFAIEMMRHTDGVEVLLPDLHRFVSLRFTRDGQLGAVVIEPTCEPDMASHRAKAESLVKSPPIQDQNLQQHLEKLKQAAEPAGTESSTSIVKQITIGVPSPAEPPSATREDAIKSVQAAAQKSFDKLCSPGSQGVVTVPSFSLNDPRILTVIKAKDLSCVLPIAFEYRRTSTDPYVAYATYNCVEDAALVEKTRRLVSESQIAAKRLVCRASQP